MPVKIFISHSCKDFDLIDNGNSKEVARWKRLQYARLVREKIVEGLGRQKDEGLGFKILLDRDRLEPGELWRAKLRNWLGICEGAVLLLSEDSVRSDWVRAEATILSYRKASFPEILLVPVFLGDLGVGELTKHGLDCLQLSENEAARLLPTDLPGGGGKVEELSDAGQEAHASCLTRKVIDAFRNLSALNLDTHLEHWVKSVALRLKKVDLEEARSKLMIHDEDWSDDGEYIEKHNLLGRAVTLAYQLLSADFKTVFEVMKVLRQEMNKEDFQWLVPHVACQWVDLQAAQRLLRTTQPKGGPGRESRLLALNASFEETAKAYVDRAHCCGHSSQRILNINKPFGEELDLELLKNFEKRLFKRLKMPRKLQEADAVTNSALRKKLIAKRDKLLKDRLAQQPFYVVLDVEASSGELDAVIYENIRKKQEYITFLLLTGESFSAIEGKSEIIEKVEPELMEDAEIVAEGNREALEELMD